MKKITLLSVCITLIFGLPGCIKTSDLIPHIPDDSIPTVPTFPMPTEIGIPDGDLVSKTIGKDGGSIVSADGNAELIFPAGALNASTIISMQAYTNTAPNGIGNSFRFLPEGIRFPQPVLLKFHYTPENLASTIADLMGIAYQDSIGAWYRVNNFTNDTVHKIISAPIKHFSIWTKFSKLIISPNTAVVHVNKDIGVEVKVAMSDEPAGLTGDTEDDEPLVRSSGTKPIVWSVNGVKNGNANLGNISGGSYYAAEFNAPNKVPGGGQNPVTVSAEVDVKEYYHGKKVDKATLLSTLRIVDEEVYLLEVRLLDSVIDTPPDLMVVWDSASMKVTIKDDLVTVSEITNFAPKANPVQIVYPSDAQFYVPDPVGEINIMSVSGKIAPYSFPGGGSDGRLLTLKFESSGTHDPKIRYTAVPNYEDFYGGEANPGYPGSWAFEINFNGDVGQGGAPFVGILDKVVDVTLTLQK